VSAGNVLDKLGEDGILTLLTETGTRLNTPCWLAAWDRIHSSSRRRSWALTLSGLSRLVTHPHGRS